MKNQRANLADPVLLEKIDKFFELGIGEYVALPQVRFHPTLHSFMATKLLSYLLWEISPGNITSEGGYSLSAECLQWEKLST